MNEYFEKLIIDPEERANFQFYETSSGLLLTESCIRDRKPIAIDLFAGAGGFSLGLIQAGFNVIAALEIDMPSIHTYLVNLGAFPVEMHFIEESDAVRAEKYFKKAIMKEESGVISISGVSGSNRQLACHDMPWFPGVRHMFVGDARKITGGEILKKIGYKRGDVDLVVGGPPCQGFTFANKKRCPEDPRNNLTLEFIRLVLDIQPKTFCMENVPGMLKMTTPEGVPIIDAICRMLEDGHYGNYENLKRSILSTADCGYAMRMKREKSETKVPKFKPKKKSNQVGLDL